MNELRRHYFLDRWVINAVGRAKRPEQFEIEEVKVHKSKCPFCPGRIDMPIYKTVGDPWRIAVIPNKFPIVSPDISLTIQEGPLESMNAFGFHDIVIDHSDHHSDLEKFSEGHVKDLLKVYAERTKTHMADDRVKYVSVFRNSGASAGESIAHPHSQIVALPIVPRLVERERGKIDEYTQVHGECPFKMIYNKEKKDGRRFLIETDHFFAIAPFASVFPGEVWIIPKRHVRTLFELRDKEIDSFSRILLHVVGRLVAMFPGLPYNIVVHQAPKGRDFHLHLEIYPRLSKFAGLELGNDLYVNILPPEDFAESFRKVVP